MTPTANVRVSVAIPAGMVIWTNGEAVVGVHMPGSGEIVPPKHFTTAHVSAANFPRGAADVRAWVEAFERDNHRPETTAEMTFEMARGLPGGVMDDSTYSAIEDALDKVEAPMRCPDGRWLTLPERVLALAADLGRLPR